MRITLILAGIVIATGAGFPATALADAQITLGDESGDRSGDVVYRIKDGKVHWSDRSSPDAEMIYDSASGSMIVVSRSRGTYMRIDEETARQARGMMDDMMKQMEAQLAQLPPEQREAMKQYMPQLGASEEPEFAVEEGGSDEVAGIECTSVTVLRDGARFTEGCIASAEAMGIDGDDFATVMGMYRMMGKVAATMKGGPSDGYLANMTGIPVRIRDPQRGTVKALRSVSTDDVDASVFEIPEGFTERSLDQPAPY